MIKLFHNEEEIEVFELLNRRNGFNSYGNVRDIIDSIVHIKFMNNNDPLSLLIINHLKDFKFFKDEDLIEFDMNEVDRVTSMAAKICNIDINLGSLVIDENIIPSIVIDKNTFKNSDDIEKFILQFPRSTKIVTSRHHIIMDNVDDDLFLLAALQYGFEFENLY